MVTTYNDKVKVALKAKSASASSFKPEGVRRPHSKTMRLDILPNSELLPSPVPPASLAAAERSDLELTPELLGHLYQHAYDAMLIANRAGEVLSGNLRASEYLGNPGESVVGLNILSIISGADEAMLARLEQTLSKERFVRIHAWCRRRSGEFFPAEIAVHQSVIGAERHLCFFMHDITWRKEAEDRLQMADVAIRTTHAGIGVIELNGMLVFANPALKRLFGLENDETITGACLSQFLSESDTTSLLLQAVQESKAWHGQVECVWRNGTRVVAECDAVGNFNSDGDLIGAVLSLNDMTDRIRATEAERVIERNRVMMESIGSVCHHLGQPSTVLLNSTEMLLRLKEEDRENRHELLNLSLSAAESLGQLLRELNDLRTYRSEPYLAYSQPEGDQIIIFDKTPVAAGIEPSTPL